jgi:hypothetical protein
MKNSNACKKYRIKEFLYNGQVRYQPQKKGWLFWHAMDPTKNKYLFSLYSIPFMFKEYQSAFIHIQCDKEREAEIKKKVAEIIEAEKKFGKAKYICCDE